MKNYTKIMEIFWLIVGIATTIYAIKLIIQTGVNEQSLIYFLPPIVSFIMWYLRRRFRNITKKE